MPFAWIVMLVVGMFAGWLWGREFGGEGVFMMALGSVVGWLILAKIESARKEGR